MNIIENEEVQYCTSCGSANKKSDVVCDECGKKIIVNHRPVWDFVKKHTKMGVKEKLKSELFDAFKDFLFKHLYGTVVSFLIAGVATTVVVTSTPYIKTVEDFPKETVLVQPETEAQDEPEEKVHSNITYCVMVYDARISKDLRRVNNYFNWDEIENFSDASELFAENGIKGYKWKGRHDMYTNPIDIGLGVDPSKVYYNDEPMPTEYRDWVESSIVTGENVTSELGKELYKNGYEVAEGDYYLMMFYDLVDYDFDAPPPLEKNPYELLKYRFLLTRKAGKKNWYIAEDILLERKGV